MDYGLPASCVLKSLSDVLFDDESVLRANPILTPARCADHNILKTTFGLKEGRTALLMKTLTNAPRIGGLLLATQKTLFAAALLTVALGANAITYADNSVYDNTQNFTGFGINSNGATAANKITNEIADDITFEPTFEGTTLSSFSFTVANLNAAAVSARAKVRFYANDGVGGGPGTLLPVVGFNFSLITFPSGVVTFTSQLTPGQFVLPTTTNTIWAGMSFDAVGSAATAAQLNKLGPGTFDPPVKGSSQDLAFFSSGTPGQFLTNNPAGSVIASPFGAAPVANFGWRFGTNAVPEPGAVAMLMGFGVSGLALIRRRKTARK